ncbi:MAG: hypothetical protein M0P50_02015 [Bacteroidales bacterium]|nr:hypothetical protein [Bacteroidales bacterium]
MMQQKIIVFVWLMMAATEIFAQSDELTPYNRGRFQYDETSFYAETKQVNQFFRRFNGEENLRGARTATDDPQYRDADLRRRYINGLFDEQSDNLPPMLKRAFVADVTGDDPKFLDFHGGEWFGEATVRFTRNGKEVFLTLFMQLVPDNLGSKWVIDEVKHYPYDYLYHRDDKSPSRFLHPLSHELDFMNLDRVFASEEHIGDYFKKGFAPDKLSIFLYELRNGTLKFNYVSGLKFHFFQLDGWYFEISEFNRPGNNRGWLISNLIRLEEGQQESLKNFIYNLD